MHTPTYTATGTTINNRSVMIIEPTLHEQLTALLDKIALPKITFQYGIRLQETPETKRRDVLYVVKTRLGYTACIAVDNDNVMRLLTRLNDAELTSIMQRVKVDYAGKLKHK